MARPPSLQTKSHLFSHSPLPSPSCLCRFLLPHTLQKAQVTASRWVCHPAPAPGAVAGTLPGFQHPRLPRCPGEEQEPSSGWALPSLGMLSPSSALLRSSQGCCSGLSSSCISTSPTTSRLLHDPRAQTPQNVSLSPATLTEIQEYLIIRGISDRLQLHCLLSRSTSDLLNCLCSLSVFFSSPDYCPSFPGSSISNSSQTPSLAPGHSEGVLQH